MWRTFAAPAIARPCECRRKACTAWRRSTMSPIGWSSASAGLCRSASPASTATIRISPSRAAQQLMTRPAWLVTLQAPCRARPAATRRPRIQAKCARSASGIASPATCRNAAFRCPRSACPTTSFALFRRTTPAGSRGFALGARPSRPLLSSRAGRRRARRPRSQRKGRWCSKFSYSGSFCSPSTVNVPPIVGADVPGCPPPTLMW